MICYATLLERIHARKEFWVEVAQEATLITSCLHIASADAHQRSAHGADPFTQPDARQFSNLLPFRQAREIKNVVNAMVGRFPEE